VNEPIEDNCGTNEKIEKIGCNNNIIDHIDKFPGYG
jgi:hypothetical protein